MLRILKIISLYLNILYNFYQQYFILDFFLLSPYFSKIEWTICSVSLALPGESFLYFNGTEQFWIHFVIVVYINKAHAHVQISF